MPSRSAMPTASLWMRTGSTSNSRRRRWRSGNPRHAGMLSGETSPAGQTIGPAHETPTPSRSPGKLSAPLSAAAQQAISASYSVSGSDPRGDGTLARLRIRASPSTTAAASLVPPTSTARTTATPRLFDLEQLLTHRVHDRLHPRMQVQLLEDVADVVLHGVLGDVQLFGDIAVVVALGDQLEDFHLAVGEPWCGELLLLVGPLDHAREVVLLLEDHLEPATEQCVVVHDQHADGVSRAPRS